MIILSGVLVVLAIALLVTGIVTGNTGHEILGLDGLKLIYVSIGVSIVSALFLAVGVFLRRKELFGTTAAPANAKASAGRTTARPVKAKARVGAGEDAAIVPVTSASATDVPDETTVYVVPGRKRYHLETCRQLAGREKEELTFVEAREEGFTPCTACLPDTALAARAALTDTTVEERPADTGTAAETRPQSAALEPVEVTRTDIPVTRALPASEPPSAEERDARTEDRAIAGSETTRIPETNVPDAESTTVPPADAEPTTADASDEPLAERSRRRGRSLFEPLDRASTAEDTDPAEEAATGSDTPDTEHRDEAARPAPAEPDDEPTDVAVTREVPLPEKTTAPEPSTDETADREVTDSEAADRETTEPEVADQEVTDAESRQAEPTATETAATDTRPAEAADDTTTAESEPEADELKAPEADEPEAARSDEHDEPAEASTDEEDAAGEPSDDEPADDETADDEAAADSAPVKTAEQTDTEPAEQSTEPAAEDTGRARDTDEAGQPEAAADADETAKAAPADDPGDTEAAGGPKVRILSGTKRYHRSDCALIEDIADDADDLESLSREEARERGCTPCLVCQPDDD